MKDLTLKWKIMLSDTIKDSICIGSKISPRAKTTSPEDMCEIKLTNDRKLFLVVHLQNSVVSLAPFRFGTTLKHMKL